MKPQVLIIDEDNEVRYVFEQLFTLKGFRATTCANSVEAVNRLSSAEYDVIVTELYLGGSCDMGHKTLAFLNDWAPATKIIVMSTYAMKPGACRADCYFNKPVSPYEVVKAAAKLVRQDTCRETKGEGI